MPERDWQTIMRGCDRWLSNRIPRPAVAILREAADAMAGDTHPDRYGDGGLVAEFEGWLAAMLGTEAAALFPSGTMAQQIALRIHCDARRTDTVAWHGTCHLALYEHDAAAHLHGLKAETVGHRDRLITLADLEALRVPIGALLLELPQRELGGRLPDWDDLAAQVGWARERGIAVHLDGARLWEATPYYGRPHAEIAALFDTVYVSLYKGLGGFAGSVLAGRRAVIDEARVWRHRHGGTLANLFPFAAGALRGLDELIPRMPEFLVHTRALAAALAAVPGITVVPDPPQTPLFHLHLAVERDALWERALDVAARDGVWLFGPPDATVVPGVTKVELNVGEPALEIAPDEAAALFARLLDT